MVRHLVFVKSLAVGIQIFRYIATFVISIIWIAVFSYIMVWMVSVCGYAQSSACSQPRSLLILGLFRI